MIGVRLTGGLGNQLFQYVAGWSLAILHRTVLYLDSSGVRLDSKRSLSLAQFSLPFGDFVSDIAVHRYEVGSRLRRVLGLDRRKIQAYREASFGYDPSFGMLTDNTVLEGGWQSYRYSMHLRSALRSSLVLRQPLSNPELDVFRQTQEESVAAIHVRRGDYVSDPITNSFHGVCSPSYYRGAIQYLRGLGVERFLVFTDDVDYAKSLFGKDPSVFIASRPGEIADSVELWLMSRCAHQITSNSTFSWWAAWLNPNEKASVVMPDPWFRRDELDAEDLYFPGVVRIPSGVRGPV